jgi:hypothetical protein
LPVVQLLHRHPLHISALALLLLLLHQLALHQRQRLPS